MAGTDGGARGGGRARESDRRGIVEGRSGEAGEGEGKVRGRGASPWVGSALKLRHILVLISAPSLISPVNMRGHTLCEMEV